MNAMANSIHLEHEMHTTTARVILEALLLEQTHSSVLASLPEETAKVQIAAAHLEACLRSGMEPKRVRSAAALLLSWLEQVGCPDRLYEGTGYRCSRCSATSPLPTGTHYTLCHGCGAVLGNSFATTVCHSEGVVHILDGAITKEERPIIVCLCGSSRFTEAFQEANRLETLAGRVVLSIGFLNNEDFTVLGHEAKLALDRLHKQKIDIADEIYVLNENGYIGQSTRSEIEYAYSKGKIVRYLQEPFIT